MKFTTAALIALGLCLCQPVLGQGVQPIISSVNGVVAPGSRMTIVGTRLNDEAKGGWIPFFTSHPNAWVFGGSSPDADGYDTMGGGSGTAVYDSNVHLFGGQSIKFHGAGAYDEGPNHEIAAKYFAVGGGDANDIWIRAYVRYHAVGGWPTSYIKMIDCQGSGEQYYFQPATTTDDTLPQYMNATYDSSAHNVAIPSGRLTNDRWYCIEIHWKSTSPHVFAAWIDGVQVINVAPVAQGSLTYLLFGLINMGGTHAGFSVDHWFGGLVVARSRIYPASLVEVGDGPDYATARKRTQTLEHISDTQVAFNLDVSGLGTGPYYLWLRNNNQQLSSAYVLRANGMPPAAPTNIRIR